MTYTGLVPTHSVTGCVLGLLLKAHHVGIKIRGGETCWGRLCPLRLLSASTASLKVGTSDSSLF